MARTQVQAELIATNAISGTIIADNAITATHIATNSISGTLVQDGGIVTTMIAANNVTAAKIVSDGIEHRHMHSNVISGLSTVTAVGGDFVIIGDTSDSNNLKKALVSDFGVTGISSSADATAITIDSSENTTFTGDVTVAAGKKFTTASGNDLNIVYPDTRSLFIKEAGTTHVTVDNTGQVGIGTTTPASPLDIVTALSSDTQSTPETVLTLATKYTATSGVDGAAGAGPRIYFKIPDDETNPSGGASIEALKENGDDSVSNTALAFSISQNDETLDEAMRINSSGNVGIGTTNPTNAALEIVRTSGEVFRADANSGAFRLVANQTDVQASLMRVTAGAVSAPSYSFIGDTTTGISRPTGSAVNFVCGGTEKGRVDTNGFKITHTSNSSEAAGQPDLGKTTFGGIHFESGSSGTSRGITWEASDGQTQAGYVVHNNGSDGTHHGWFSTNTYSGGPYCRMKLSNYGSLVLGPATDIGSVTPASSSAVHVNYGDVLVNATASATSLSDLLPGYSRGSYGCLKSNGAYIYFAVNGSYVSYINSSGTYSTSDARLKENVTNLTGSLDKIKQLRGVNFTWKDTETRGSESNIGFLAHEVEPHFPEIVGDGALPNPDDETAESYKNVNYAALVPALVESIKELEARIKILEG